MSCVAPPVEASSAGKAPAQPDGAVVVVDAVVVVGGTVVVVVGTGGRVVVVTGTRVVDVAVATRVVDVGRSGAVAGARPAPFAGRVERPAPDDEAAGAGLGWTSAGPDDRAGVVHGARPSTSPTASPATA